MLDQTDHVFFAETDASSLRNAPRHQDDPGLQ
jgi:hypothetical protein